MGLQVLHSFTISTLKFIVFSASLVQDGLSHISGCHFFFTMRGREDTLSIFNVGGLNSVLYFLITERLQ